MSRAYYNEIDPFAAQWLRNLISAGHIAPGEVDQRSIVDVTPSDLKGFTQCHFFAGIGVWSYALRLAGWPDSRPVWTGSCPCQPFSAAGKRAGFDDQRHLWPAWYWLIEQCRPDIIFGEQVANGDGTTWIDLVSTDLEGIKYSVGPINLPACGVGAPHIRQRLWFVATSVGQADANRVQRGLYLQSGQPREQVPEAARSGEVSGVGLADAMLSGRSQGWPESGDRSPPRSSSSDSVAQGDTCGSGARRDTGAVLKQEEKSQSERCLSGDQPNGPVTAGSASGVALGDSHEQRSQGRRVRSVSSSSQCAAGSPGPVNGFWTAAEWTPCRDGKARPTQPGIFPLAHGATQRVGRLRAYGNAIVAQVAAEVIRAAIEVLEEAAV